MEKTPFSFEARYEETRQETEALITLSLVPGIGSVRSRILVSHFGSAQRVLEASPSALAKVEGIGRQIATAIHGFDDYEQVRYQIECAEKVQARIVTYWSPDYPSLLRSIFDPPAFLWVRGALQNGSEESIAIVGTRRPSSYGKRATTFFARELASRNYTIVSGLAHGVDTLAHEATLDAGGRTIAVLGSGVDWIYPTVNKKLARRILEHGAILSEYPMRTKPEAANFPRRNRIISGLARGTLVTEAYEKGGALITARMAAEQNREVFAVPGPVFNDSVKGVHRLVQLGYGKLVHDVEDVLVELGATFDKKAVQVVPEKNMHEDLNALEVKLYNVLNAEPMQINTICTKSGLDPSTALVYLLSLEFKGLVLQMAGKQFYKVS